MIVTSEFHQLKKLCGIAGEYQDSQNKQIHVPEEHQAAVLKTIVADISEQGIQQALTELSYEKYQRTLPPVKVFREGQSIEIPVNFPDSYSDLSMSWQLETEQLTVLKGEACLSKEPIARNDAIVPTGFYTKYLVITDDLPVGCHQLKISSGDAEIEAQMTLIIAQQKCYRQKELIDERKLFGFSAQLYTIRSARNWGIGDFTDLRQFVIEAAANKVDIVGLNPLHALFPANPLSFAPYSPSNRAFLNVMYIDPQAIKEYQTCKEAKELVESQEFQAELKQLRNTGSVDYLRVANRKFQVLNILFDDFLHKHVATNSSRAKGFDLFLQEQGDALFHHATFDALLEFFLAQDESLSGWSVWPEAYRDPHSPEVREFQRTYADKISYFMYLQWIASEQLKAAQDEAVNAGMAIGVYLDLAVGINPGGSEAWANQNLFSFQASVGAPPDDLATEGQDWGFPPFEPKALRETTYELFVKNLRANMVSAGAVRFDHCVSLLRLWWIPMDRSSKEGAYVHYDIDEITGLLALESHRNKCMVVGEDLGTVPAVLPKIMEDNAIYCYRVLYFEFDDERMKPPENYPRHAVATLNTHDVAPLNSWWTCSDIELREQLSVVTDAAQVSYLKKQRDRDKQLILNAMHHYGYIGEFMTIDQVPEMTIDLNAAIHNYLASSNAAVMISQLEDWMAMETPVNVPGTFMEYPNWQRKLSQPIEGFFTKPENVRRLSSILKIRQRAALEQ